MLCERDNEEQEDRLDHKSVALDLIMPAQTELCP